MTDYISREAATRAIVELTSYHTVQEINAYVEGAFYRTNQWIGGVRDALIEIGDLPAADMRPVRWIPVSERLPDMNDYDWVLGVVSGKFGYTVFQNAVICVGYDPDFGFFLEEYPDVEITVSHWMPLPEPPKED